eukprot:5357599-Pyramimonas_sp.AAC.1
MPPGRCGRRAAPRLPGRGDPGHGREEDLRRTANQRHRDSGSLQEDTSRSKKLSERRDPDGHHGE